MPPSTQAPPRTRSPAARTVLTVLGAIIVIVSPIIGAIPGPGGIFVFAAGLALMLQNSAFVRRRFVRAKRRWPRFGNFADLGLRRRSALRRWRRDRPLNPDGTPTSARARIARAIRGLLPGRPTHKRSD